MGIWLAAVTYRRSTALFFATGLATNQEEQRAWQFRLSKAKGS
jgi:hypothetical protein